MTIITVDSYLYCVQHWILMHSSEQDFSRFKTFSVPRQIHISGLLSPKEMILVHFMPRLLHCPAHLTRLASKISHVHQHHLPVCQVSFCLFFFLLLQKLLIQGGYCACLQETGTWPIQLNYGHVISEPPCFLIQLTPRKTANLTFITDVTGRATRQIKPRQLKWNVDGLYGPAASS